MKQMEKPEFPFDGEGAAEKRYQINPNFVMRQIAGEYAIIPVGEESLISNALMTPNASAVFLWNAFAQPNTEEQVVQAGLQAFDGPEEQIRKDVQRFVKESLHYRILMEVN